MRHHQPQPAGIAADAVGRQHQEHGGGARLQIGEAEIRAAEHRGHARAVEKVGVALRGGQHARGFAIGLGGLPVGGTRDQAALVLHVGEQA